MKAIIGLSLPILAMLFSCGDSIFGSKEATIVSLNDTVPLAGIPNENAVSLENLPAYVRPVFGYRFVISGDFDGDGNKERLTEHFFSTLNNRETNKFYDGLEDYDDLVWFTIKKKPRSFVTSDNSSIDTLCTSFPEHEQLLGLSYLKNEGDLNGDGTDEVSYVIHWADWSNANTWHLMTYRNKKWEELYRFNIWDWQIPDLPETFNHYGLFGLENKTVITGDTISKQMERELNDFEGLVKSIRPNLIRVIFKNEEASMDTAMVDLRHKIIP